MQIPVQIPIQIANKQLKKKYYLMHQQKDRLHQLNNNDNSTNIFLQKQMSEDYFTTFPTENPFTPRKQISGQKKYQSFTTQQISHKKPSRQILRIHNQSIYKQDKFPTEAISHSASCNDKTMEMPQIKKTRAVSNRTALIGESKRHQLLHSHKNRLDKIVNKFLYHKGMASQVSFNADLRKRCGEQYFQQILRDRHKEDMKPMPYLYSLKNNSQKIETPFIKYIKQQHPQIRIRQKMKIKGVNKFRIKTQINPQKQDAQYCKPKLNINLSKLRTSLTQRQLY